MSSNFGAVPNTSLSTVTSIPVVLFVQNAGLPFSFQTEPSLGGFTEGARSGQAAHDPGSGIRVGGATGWLGNREVGGETRCGIGQAARIASSFLERALDFRVDLCSDKTR